MSLRTIASSNKVANLISSHKVDAEQESTDRYQGSATLTPSASTASRTSRGEDERHGNAYGRTSLHVQSTHVRHIFRCAVGLHFIESKNSCDWPENSNCVDNVPSSAASVRTNAPGEGLPCDVLGAYAKDPTTTCGTTYFWCINNKWYRQSCQAGTAWEHEKSLCNYCAVVDGCDGESEHEGDVEWENFEKLIRYFSYLLIHRIKRSSG